MILAFGAPASEVRGSLTGPVKIPARDFLAVLGALVDESVGGSLVLLEELDEISDGGDDGRRTVLASVDPGHLKHVADEMLHVADSGAEIDGVVDVSYDRFVGSDEISDALGEVVGLAVAEDVDYLFAVPYGELDGEVV